MQLLPFNTPSQKPYGTCAFFKQIKLVRKSPGCRSDIGEIRIALLMLLLPQCFNEESLAKFASPLNLYLIKVCALPPPPEPYSIYFSSPIIHIKGFSPFLLICHNLMHLHLFDWDITSFRYTWWLELGLGAVNAWKKMHLMVMSIIRIAWVNRFSLSSVEFTFLQT